MIQLRAQHVRTRLTIWYMSVLAGIVALYVAGSSVFIFLNLRQGDHQNPGGLCRKPFKINVVFQAAQ